MAGQGGAKWRMLICSATGVGGDWGVREMVEGTVEDKELQIIDRGFRTEGHDPS